jgi:site-specific DNA recombinase
MATTTPKKATGAVDEQRVATYVRISTDEDRQPFSLEAQGLRLDAFITSQPGWRHVKTYTDQFSGAYAERPGLNEALRDARLGVYDVLLVYRVDRFARSLKVLVGLLEELDQMGVAFRSATEPIDTANPTGRMLVQLLGVFAEFERATIIDRVVAGMERKAARGHWPGGRLPYGLTIDAEKRLAVKDDELPLIEEIFDAYANKRLGADRIATELNARGHHTRSGRPFSRQVVLNILRNRSYLGEVSFRGAIAQSSEAPFIDTHLFSRAEAVLAERGEGYAERFAKRRPPYLFTGLLTCGGCGRLYIGAASSGKAHRYRYYLCWSRNRYGPQTCDWARLRADGTEASVLDDFVNRFYAQPDLLLEATAAQRDGLEQRRLQREGELRTTTAEREEAEQGIERYMVAFERGTLPEEAFAERVRDLALRVKTLGAREKELREFDEADEIELTLAGIEMTHRCLKVVTKVAPDEIRKEIAQAFIKNLKVEGPTRLIPTYRVISLPTDSSVPIEDDETGSRAMTGLVDATGLEPVTSAV